MDTHISEDDWIKASTLLRTDILLSNEAFALGETKTRSGPIIALSLLEKDMYPIKSIFQMFGHFFMSQVGIGFFLSSRPDQSGIDHVCVNM